ncbi:MAG: hypothetical protein EA415_00455, partial [Sphaerobacteraceae bacterium]
MFNRRHLTWAAVLVSLLMIGGIASMTSAQDGDIITLTDDDPQSLIGAINDANASSVLTIIELMPDATYSLTDARDGISLDVGPTAVGLPIIESMIRITGNGATIERDLEAEDEFRIMDVSSSGSLLLEDATIRGGYLTPTSSVGGAIQNFGTLQING